MQINNSADESRRGFLKKLASAGALTMLQLSPLALTSCSSKYSGKIGSTAYAYRSFSVTHLPEMYADIKKLKADGKISDQATFRSYIDNRDFKVPEDFPEATSVIMIATFTPLQFATFNHNGIAHEFFLPPGYFNYPPEEKLLQEVIHNEIIGESGHKLAYAGSILLKTAAARSGLSEYGRNNIAYVKGMGSYLSLSGYFTDAVLEDNWQEAKMLKACENCDICINECPNECISKEKFVIDVGRCTTLYNEVDGTFPEFIKKDAHNAIMGCMHCQLSCPENQKVFEKSEYLEPITEQETRHILDNTVTKEIAKDIGAKLKGFGGVPGYYPTVTRNLKALL
ncbi:hypothetical protein KAR48_11035 [bacterium]|nr:hypothetical protein [bacterium]